MNAETTQAARIGSLTEAGWDSFVLEHPNGWLCHLSAWGRVLEQAFGHMRGHCVAIVRDGKVAAGMPLYEVRSRLTGDRLVSTPFATISDPLVSTADDLGELLGACRALSRDLAIGRIEVRTFRTSLQAHGEHFSRESSFKQHYLELEGSLEAINRRFHRSCVRQRISRSVSSGVEVQEGKSESDFRAFYRLYVLNRKKLGLPPQPWAFLRALWDTFSDAGQVQLLLARWQQRVVGGVLLFKYKERVSAEFAVSDDNFRPLSPLHGLFWEAIQVAHREGYRVFDFGRTAIDNRTLLDFKGRWGTSVTDLVHYRYPPSAGGGEKTCRPSLGREVIRRVCRAAPTPVLEGLGRLLYRHLS